MSSRNYTENDIASMNASNIWRNCIICDNSKSSHDSLYELHPTGNADLDGRKYVSLPKGTVITEEIKRKYNII